MTTRFTASTLLALATTASAALGAVDPQLLALSLPDAKVLAGVQVTQSKNSPFGQYLLNQAALTAPQFDQLKALTGFDPRTDLTEVVVSSAGDGKGLVVARGTFQPTRISNLATQGGNLTTVHGGIYVISADAHQSGAAAFLNASTVVAGDKAAVEAAIDRWIGGSLASGALVSEANAAGASAHAWMVAIDIAQLAAGTKGQNNAPVPPEAAAIQNLLSAVGQISGGVTFGDTQITVHGKAQTKTAQDASSLADALRFLSGMALAQKPAGIPNVTPTFTASGNTMEFTAALDEKQAEGLFQLKPGRAPKMAVQQVAARR